MMNANSINYEPDLILFFINSLTTATMPCEMDITTYLHFPDELIEAQNYLEADVDFEPRESSSALKRLCNTMTD